MTARHVNLQQRHRRRRVNLLAQRRNPLGGFHVEHAGVVQARHSSNRRVTDRADVLVRGVRLHVGVHFRVLNGVAPFFPLHRRQRQLRVEDGGQRIHERYGSQAGGVLFGGEVHDGAHEQAAGATAVAADTRLISPRLSRNVAGDVHEVGEGVLLRELLTVLVPGAAHLAAAANMRNDVDDAAVQDR